MQPLAASSAAAAMQNAGAEVLAWDAHTFPGIVPSANPSLIMLSVQQFEGIERALTLTSQLRARWADAALVAFGQYAQLNSAVFLEVTDGIVMDEPERASEALAAAAAGTTPLAEVPAMLTRGRLTPPGPRRRLAPQRPARELFPSLVHYPTHHTRYGLMGNVEVTRGCHHKCTYCSVYGAYNGGVAPYEFDSVLADARQLAEEGVTHFCFIDAEFLNSRTLGPEAVRRIAAELGPCTFEFTTRVDHILDYPDLLRELAGLGVRRITSALEFPSDRILRIFDKGIDVADMRRAIAEAEQIGVELNPTFIPFTPWVRYDELLTFEDFLVETGLARTADPTVLQTRLLLFKGSPLLSSPWMEDVETVDRGLWLDWRHHDLRVEGLWEQRRQEAEGAGRGRCCVKC